MCKSPTVVIIQFILWLAILLQVTKYGTFSFFLQQIFFPVIISFLCDVEGVNEMAKYNRCNDDDSSHGGGP